MNAFFEVMNGVYSRLTGNSSVTFPVYENIPNDIKEPYIHISKYNGIKVDGKCQNEEGFLELELVEHNTDLTASFSIVETMLQQVQDSITDAYYATPNYITLDNYTVYGQMFENYETFKDQEKGARWILMPIHFFLTKN